MRWQAGRSVAEIRERENGLERIKRWELTAFASTAYELCEKLAKR